LPHTPLPQGKSLCLYKGKDKERISAFKLKSVSVPHSLPLLQTKIGKASNCHTERRKTDKEGRGVVFIAMLAVEEQQLYSSSSFNILVPWRWFTVVIMCLDLVGPEVEELEVELYVFICTWILMAPRLRNLRLSYMYSYVPGSCWPRG
jgi:hypothetical protein